MKRIDRTGQENGKLTITGPAPSKGKHTYWYCRCECGKTVAVASSNLSKTLSCGCGKEDYLAKDKWEAIAVQTHGYLLPMAYIRKSQLSEEDRKLFRNGYWLCRCTRCHSWVTATTVQIRTGQLMGCERCTPRAHDAIFWAEIGLIDAVRLTWTRSTYYGMIRRCRDKTETRYGGRDIKVCDRWAERDGTGLKNFIADMGVRKHRRFTLERIDGDGDYTPENCIWANDPTQRRNRSDSRKFLVDGKQINLVDLAALVGRDSKSVSRRIDRLVSGGFTEQQAVEQMIATHSVR